MCFRYHGAGGDIQSCDRYRGRDTPAAFLDTPAALQATRDRPLRSHMNRIWLNFLPAIIRRRLDGQHNVQAVLGNIGWLFIDKILRMGVGFFVGAWVIRYLGPERYGALNFSIAFVALFSVVATLGLEGIVVRDIVHDPSCRDETLASAFALKLIGGGICMVLAVTAITFIRPAEPLYWWLVGIAAASTIFQSLDVIDYSYQAEVRSIYTVYARNAAFLLVVLLKITLILVGAPLITFAWAGLVEVGLAALGLLLICDSQGKSLKPRLATFSRARRLLRQSWPLVISALFVVILMRTDQVMLGQMRGDRDVGIFSAALALSEIWYFVPMVITSSVFPAMAKAWSTDKKLFYQRLKQLYVLMIWLSLGVAIPLTLFSSEIVTLLYGRAFQSTATVLAIHCWAGIFLFLGVVSNMWYLLENLNHYTLYRCIVGAMVNVGLNFLLIPAYGAKGAAVSTLVAQFFASYLFDLLNKRTRNLFAMKTESALFFIPLTARYALRAMHRHGTSSA
jgi:PST family polysaccharide transporter